jgi:hypothetical protein
MRKQLHIVGSVEPEKIERFYSKYERQTHKIKRPAPIAKQKPELKKRLCGWCDTVQFHSITDEQRTCLVCNKTILC